MMSADHWAQAGAATLAVSGIIAAVAMYVLLGLHVPPGTRVRMCAFAALLTIAAGATADWIAEALASMTTARVVVAAVRFAIAIALLVLAYGIYRDATEPARSRAEDER
jgi:hypothetical protein